MTPEHDKYLCEKYPKLYAQRNGDPMSTLMCFGFEVGDGWFSLIDKLSAKLEKLNDTKDAKIEAMQVKEKYGSLRFYINGVPIALDKEVYAAINEAEDESYKTCESCGKPGEPNDRGWISTLCPECRKPIEAEREKNLQQMKVNLEKMAKSQEEIKKQEEKSRNN
jgi:hypothetical protein